MKSYISIKDMIDSLPDKDVKTIFKKYAINIAKGKDGKMTHEHLFNDIESAYKTQMEGMK